MNPIKFYYHAIYQTAEKAPPPVGLICGQYTHGPTRTVLWNHMTREWTFNRAVGARILSDDEKQERISIVSRAEAERIAREAFGTELPSEAELDRLSTEGEAALESR